MRRAFALLALAGLLLPWRPAAAAAYSVDIALDPDSGAIDITGELRLDADGPTRLRLAPWIEIRRLARDGERLDYRRDGEWLTLDLPGGGEAPLALELRGVVPPRAAAGAPPGGSSSGDDGIYLPAYDAWLPTPADGARADYRLRLSTPLPWRAVASADLADEDESGGRYRATFTAGAAGEAPSLFAGPYRVEESRYGALRVRTWFHPGLESLAAGYRDAVAAYIDRYDALIGPYPYPEFHVVSAPLPVGLGFANLTYVGREVLPLPFMRGRSLAHEVLHAWWGNGVAVDYAGGNWAEGLTTYLADYALAADAGAASARDMRLKWLRDYAALPASRDTAIVRFRGKYHDAAQVVGYGKTAFVFHMLADEIGRPAFDAGLRELWRAHRFDVAGWADLRAAFERASGRDLGWFFEQWLQRPGAPRLALGDSRVETFDDGYRVSLDIRQQAPHYRLRLPLRLETDAGAQWHEALVDGPSTRIELQSRGAPLAVQVDPDSAVFRRLAAQETPPIMRDVTLNPGTLTWVASDDSEFRALAGELAGRVLDTPPRTIDSLAAAAPGRPLLLIAESGRLPALLGALGLGEAPLDSAAGAAWSARRAGGAPVLVVAAPDAAALRTLMRPLPHYGGQSYIVIDGGRVGDRGVWPVAAGPLLRRF